MATRFAIAVDRTSNEIRGLWRADKPTVPDSTAEKLSVEVTGAVHGDISRKGMQFSGGGARFKWDGTQVVEQTDNRPRLRFTPP